MQYYTIFLSEKIIEESISHGQIACVFVIASHI